MEKSCYSASTQLSRMCWPSEKAEGEPGRSNEKKGGEPCVFPYKGTAPKPTSFLQVIMGRKPTNGKPHRVLQKDGCWSPAHCSLDRMCLSGMCLTKFSLTQIPQLGIQCLLREATAHLSNSSPPEPPLPRSHTP